MIRTHYANRVEALVDRLAQQIANDPPRVLDPEFVVVSNPATGRWLTLELARRNGICANVRFALPGAFVWDQFRAVLSDLPETNGYAPHILSWRIMSRLADIRARPGFEPVDNWLGRKDATRRYELSTRLAEAFDQYLVYRPDWIEDWESGEGSVGTGSVHAHWQSTLWRDLVSTVGGPHWFSAWKRFVDSPLPESSLPRRFSLFALPSLSPGYLDVLRRLGKASDVDLYVVNPCREYWSDIVSRRSLARRSTAGDSASSFLETGNALLASLGGQGAEFVNLLQDLGADETEDYREPEYDTLLGAIQADILNLRDHGKDLPVGEISPHDRSLVIQVCHGPMREVEVLHDQLLAMFDRDGTLSASDVTVLTPDPATYLPLVETVFGGVEAGLRIPYSTGPAGMTGEHPLVRALDTLLDTASGRFEADIVLGLLDEPGIRRRFGLEDVDVERVHELVRTAEIRWGVDAGSRASEGLPETSENTWRTGLDRLLLGYAMGGGGGGMVAGILPCDGISGADSRIVGSLWKFARDLSGFRDRLGGEKEIPVWVACLRDVLTGFFQPDEEDEIVLRGIREALAALEHHADSAGFSGTVPLPVVRSALVRILGGGAGGSQSFSGGVLFGGLSIVRGIPRRVICLLGMNDGAFPRADDRFDFDLMRDDYRPGDRSRRDDDRYLFLETLLCARERLYISYTGRDARDNSVRPPSTLVSELLDSVARGWRAAGGGDAVARITTVHALQPFHPDYFSGKDDRFSYDARMLEATRASLSPRPPPPFLSGPLAPPDAGGDPRRIALADLERFFRNPARELLRHRFGIRLDDGAPPLERTEPFRLERFGAADLRRELVRHAWDDVSARESFELCRARGWLPHGNVGRHAFDEELSRIRDMLPKIEPWRDDLSCAADVEFPVSESTILWGRIRGAGRTGIIEWQPVNLSAHCYVGLWVRHLALQASGVRSAEIESRIVSCNETLHLRPVERPLRHMSELLQIYDEGLCDPLPFFPRSSLAYARAELDGKSDPLGIARNIWDADPKHGWPESDNPYYRLAFAQTEPLDARFEATTMAVFGPLLEHAGLQA